MKELYKVRKVEISILDRITHETQKDVSCEFGVIKENEGVLFLEAHIFDDKAFANFDYNSLGSPAKAKMYSFNDIEIDAPFMVFTGMTTDECTVTFKCFNYITVYEEDSFYAFSKASGDNDNQLLRIDFWGLDLLIPGKVQSQLMVGDAPFDIQFNKDPKTGVTFATFPINEEVAHNTLTVELFELFRYSLEGYLSLINGTAVFISKEYYNGYVRIISYNKVENASRSYYACGSAKFFRPSSILFEFDNYVRWNKLLNLNKFVSHLCASQQLLYLEDRAFILILVFEGLCKKYIELQKEARVPENIISDELFKRMSKDFLDLTIKYNLSDEQYQKFKGKIESLNKNNLATYKFRLILDDTNIQETSKIKKLIRNVRSTLVHEARLKGHEDYQLLSELIREVILRLINSKVERYSEFSDPTFIGDAPNLSYEKFIAMHDLDVNEPAIISQYDNRIKLKIKQ